MHDHDDCFELEVLLVCVVADIGSGLLSPD